ncbi:M1 family metallopeptidase [Roseivirga sp. BDSF3-8]|uniref:M1 family metallopeptidase n=1 Tax=Roseivirga sp. BDSF3-8 TaxID=3241598 RepID=UPI003532029D
MRTFLFLLIAILTSLQALAQSYSLFSPADTLKGGLRPERTSFDVHFYDLRVSVDPDAKVISGQNTIHFTVNQPTERIQIDLFPELEIHTITGSSAISGYDRLHGAIFIDFVQILPAGSNQTISITYSGKPQEAKTPPWDGGFVWEQDEKGRPWIATAVQGQGASLWWPVKEHLSDEPDSMAITCTVPNGLTCVSNGNLRDESHDRGQGTFRWFVSYPINVYNVALNIGHYAQISDKLQMGGQEILADYYVLDYHEDKAEKNFPKWVKEMFLHYNKLLGPYPFPDDGYALVEVPYWGMEHQSAVAYGNEFKLNEYGFDFILIHETGHEYFGNSISSTDPAELWIHEAFTTYLEVLFLESRDGYEISEDYLESKLSLIRNNQPILGPMGVYYEDWNDADMYYKGAWMLHSIRHMVDSDKKWHKLIRQFYQTFKGKSVNTEMVINFFNEQTEVNVRPVFHHFLTELHPPRLAYRIEGRDFFYKWLNTGKGFNMPVEIKAGNKTYRLTPTSSWQQVRIPKRVTPKFSTEKFYFVPEKTE